jgi:endonuclease/exonuclease/phosphatase family metal-dependent hydrolase
MRHTIAYLLKLVSLAVAFATLLAYLAPYINPQMVPWLAFFGTAYPWILMVNIALMLLWWWGRDRFALYHLGIILVGWNALYAFLALNWSGAPAPEGSLRVMTHNLGNILEGQLPTAANYERKADAYAAYLIKVGVPDILCTQETSGYFYRRLAERLQYPHVFNLKKGTVTFSKYPMVAGGDIPLGRTGNSVLWTDLKTGEGFIRVYNVHLQSNGVADDAKKILGDPDAFDNGSFNEVKGICWKVGSATKIRSKQAIMVRQHIADSKHPVLVCGDLNDTPTSFVFRVISEGLQDSFQESGFGIGTTFAGALPLLRIDYILHGPEMASYQCKTLRKPFSDHYGVAAAIQLNLHRH